MSGLRVGRQGPGVHRIDVGRPPAVCDAEIAAVPGPMFSVGATSAERLGRAMDAADPAAVLLAEGDPGG